jgi:hypothetical protein
MGMADRTPPTPEEYQGWPEAFSNWGRWGDSDELGTLNLVTDTVRVAAAGLVRSGPAVSLARAVDTHPSPKNPFPAHHMVAAGGAGGLLDTVGMFIHGLATTHIEALAAVCVEHDRWEFHLTVAPLVIPRGTGSQVNPIALF